MTKEKSKEEDYRIHQEQYTVRVHEINQAEELNLPSLMRLMQETSMRHIIKLKASIWDQEENPLTWVLLRKNINTLHPITRGEKIRILTYPTAFEKFFAYRDFLVFNSQKKLVATASSMWSLIDVNTRKIIRIPEKYDHIVAPNNIKRLKRPESKIIIPTSLPYSSQRTIHHYDLDWNGHTNNVVLFRQMIEILIENGTNERDLKSIEIHFKNETKMGDNLEIAVDESLTFASIKTAEKQVAYLKVSLPLDKSS